MNKRNNTTLIISIVLIVVTLFSLLTIYASSTASQAMKKISAYAAVLFEPETEKILYSKNEMQRLPMASTTKIMTAIVAIESTELTDSFKIPKEAIGIEGSSAYLKEGDVYSMEELLYALLLQSANDAAAAIAYHVSGSIDGFAALMNEKAASLGLSDTHFTNPHGLDDKEHYTTASDLAKIAAYALKNDDFSRIVSTYKKTYTRDERTRTYVNHNKLIKMYDGCVGVKTGFTKKSGRCLVSAACKNGLTLIAVTLDAPSDWQDHEAMLDYGYNTLEKLCLARASDTVYTLPVIDGEYPSVKITVKNDVSVILEKKERCIKEYVKLPRFKSAPISEGEILGEIIYTSDGEIIAKVPLTAAENVKSAKSKGFLKKILYSIKNNKG